MVVEGNGYRLQKGNGYCLLFTDWLVMVTG